MLNMLNQGFNINENSRPIDLSVVSELSAYYSNFGGEVCEGKFVCNDVMGFIIARLLVADVSALRFSNNYLLQITPDVLDLLNDLGILTFYVTLERDVGIVEVFSGEPISDDFNVDDVKMVLAEMLRLPSEIKLRIIKRHILITF